MSSRTFFIRCDSSNIIGSGHVMRCLNLAIQLKKSGNNAHFLCQPLPGNVSERIVSAGFPLTELSSTSGKDHYKIDQDQDALQTISNLRAPSTIIVDHYGLNAEWQEKVREHGKLVVIDDLANRAHTCDILVNQNYRMKGPALYNGLINKDATILMGPAYALISPDYRQYHNLGRPQKFAVERIVIFFGASDPSNVTLKCLQAAAKIKDPATKIDVVLGKNHTDRNSIESLALATGNVEIYDYIENFAGFLAGANIMIGAGGVTQWERCCLGIPGLIIAIADNQIDVAKGLHDINAGLYLGWHTEVTVETIASALKSLLADQTARSTMAESAWSLVDGKGVERVSRALLAPPIFLRCATSQDTQNLYDWRNNEETRKNSHNTEIIEFSTHTQWVKDSLKNPARNLLIAEAEGVPFGVLRFDYEGKIATISIYLAPEFIGQGWGSGLLKTGSSWVKKNRPDIDIIHAYIKDDNLRSRKTFLSSGYCDKENYFELALHHSEVSCHKNS